MSRRDRENFTYFSSRPKIKLDQILETPTKKIKQKFIDYKVTSDNLHVAIRDLTMPFDILRHFDENKKPNRKFLAPLKGYFGFKSNGEIKKTEFSYFSGGDDNETIGIRENLMSVQLRIKRLKEKGGCPVNIPHHIAKSLNGVNSENYFSVCRLISNTFWSFSDAVREYDSKSGKNHNEELKIFYDFSHLSQIFENIFYEAYTKLGEPNFSSLTGQNFLNFLAWRNICHTGPFLDESDQNKKVAIYVMGQFEILKIFNFGTPVHGLFMFHAEEFRNWKKFEPLPKWFSNLPKVVDSSIDNLVSGFQLKTFI